MTLTPAHILLVEDNEGDVLLTTEALSESTILNTLSVVKDGWEAIQFLEKKGIYSNVSLPDLILLDINLPKINGHEVVNYIKKCDSLKHIPVIMLTTSASASDVNQSHYNLANYFITKPFDMMDYQKIIAVIERFCPSTVQSPPRSNK